MKLKKKIVTDTVQIIASQPMTIISGTFTNNKAFNKGGSIYLDFQTLGLTTSTFENGRAKHGGSIYFRQISRFYKF